MITDKTAIKSEIGHTVEIEIHLIEADEIFDRNFRSNYRGRP